MYIILLLEQIVDSWCDCRYDFIYANDIATHKRKTPSANLGQGNKKFVGCVCAFILLDFRNRSKQAESPLFVVLLFEVAALSSSEQVA
jgi:hypothetical protein